MLDFNQIRTLQAAATAETATSIPMLAEHQRLATELISSPEKCRVLAACFPSDPMAAYQLPELARWASSRDKSRDFTRELGMEFDGLASRGFSGEYVSLPHACAALARLMVEPRRDLCIIATA